MTAFSTDATQAAYAPALVRFVTDGLLATIDSYLVGGLPLHRLARELPARIDVLAELHPPARTLTRLRWLQRDVERRYAELSDAGRAELTADEQHHLAGTVDTLRTALTALLPLPWPHAGIWTEAGGRTNERAAERAARRRAGATAAHRPGEADTG
jgi:hypothetical protein